MFNSAFQHLCKHPEVDLYPEPLREAIDATNAWVYPAINNGVYRAGFATKQAPCMLFLDSTSIGVSLADSFHPFLADDAAIEDLYAGLDRAEAILSKSRYLCGDRFTEADLRLFVTLIRFDIVYVTHFKCNRAAVREYPAIMGFVRDVYQMPGIAETVNMDHIRHHYQRSHPSINLHGIVAAVPNLHLDAPHGREVLAASTI